MNLGTAIIGLIISICCALPFVLTGRDRKKNEQKLLQSFFQLAEKCQCKVSQYELWLYSALGFDDTLNMLLFYRKTHKNETAFTINLSEIEHCKPIITTTTIKSKVQTIKEIEKIELAISYKSKGKIDSVLEFYNAELNPQLNGEFQLIEKWVKIINDKLKSQK